MRGASNTTTHRLGRLLAALAALAIIALTGPSAAAAASSPGRDPATALSVLAVVPCTTDFGVSPPPSAPPTPNKLPVLLPAAVARRLNFYSNGFQTLLAPRGWACRGLVAADGGRHLSAFPAGQGDPLNPAQSTGNGQAVTVVVPSSGTGQVSSLVCALFPPANTTVTCSTPKPAAETVQRPTSEVALFHDPPHVQGSGTPSGGAAAADGAVIYVSQVPAGAAATCTLATQGPTLCPWVLNDFIARNYPTSSLSASGTGP